jgi:hypothetical protein
VKGKYRIEVSIFNSLFVHSPNQFLDVVQASSILPSMGTMETMQFNNPISASFPYISAKKVNSDLNEYNQHSSNTINDESDVYWNPLPQDGVKCNGAASSTLSFTGSSYDLDDLNEYLHEDMDYGKSMMHDFFYETK